MKFNLDITEKQALECRKHCLPTLRKLNLKSPLDFAPHELEWSVLNEARSIIMRAANELLTRAEGKEEGETPGMEAAHAALTAMYDAAEGERDARGKLENRSPRPNGGDVRRPIGADTHAAEKPNGAEWRDLKTGKQVRVLDPSESLASVVREAGRGDDLDGLGIGGFVRAAVLGPKNDAERRALGGSLGTTGGYGVPILLAANVIDVMRRQSVVFKAGARTVVMESNQLDMARLNEDPIVSWRGENQEITESDPTFGKISFYAKSCACLVKLSRELIEDAPNIDAAVNNALGQAMALDLDRVSLTGEGNIEPTGVRNFPGRNTVDLGGNGLALGGYDDLLDAHYELDLDHVPEDGRTALMHPRTRRDFSKLKDGEGLPLAKPDRVQTMPFFSTTGVSITDTQGGSTNASRVYLGHWPHLLIGIRTELVITILRERYADFGQFALLAWLRADVNAEHEQSFCDIAGVLPSS